MAAETRAGTPVCPTSVGVRVWRSVCPHNRGDQIARRPPLSTPPASATVSLSTKSVDIVDKDRAVGRDETIMTHRVRWRQFGLLAALLPVLLAGAGRAAESQGAKLTL